MCAVQELGRRIFERRLGRLRAWISVAVKIHFGEHWALCSSSSDEYA
jgi:hypothetical protein